MIRFLLLGVPVSIHPSLWLTLALLGWSYTAPSVMGTALFALALFVCFLVHEMGHALVGRWLGGGSPEIRLAWLGGACRNTAAKLTPMQDIVMTAAGPLSTVAMGVLVMLGLMGMTHSVSEGFWLSVQFTFGKIPEGCLEMLHPSTLFFCVYLLQVSIWLAVLNLLPIFPMDGGQILCGMMKSPRRMHYIGMVVSGVCAALSWLVGAPLFTIVMGFLSYFNYRFYRHTLH